MFVRRTAAALAVALFATVPGAAAIAAPVDKYSRAGWAAWYLSEIQEEDGRFQPSFGTAHASTADAVLALVAAETGAREVRDAIAWLGANAGTIDNPGKRAKVVLAVVAAGYDPSDFGGEDLIADINATYSDGVYASSEFSQVLDQALTILALRSAGRSVPRAAVVWLAGAQCPDGGWQFDQPHAAGENAKCFDRESGTDFSASDTNTTAYVLQALAAARRSVALDGDPFLWLHKRRDDRKGGWGFDRKYSLTDSASTALVLQAFAAHDVKPPKGARGALRDLQRICASPQGGFSRGWIKTENGLRREPGVDSGNSVAALMGLLEEPLPIAPAPYLSRITTHPPCPVP